MLLSSRTKHQGHISRPRTDIGGRAFSAAGPRVCYNLPIGDRPQTAGLVIQPFQTVAEHKISIWSLEPKRSVNPARLLLTALRNYLLTYLIALPCLALTCLALLCISVFTVMPRNTCPSCVWPSCVRRGWSDLLELSEKRPA